MSNICDTQYKVRGSYKAMSDLWNTLQSMEVNTYRRHKHRPSTNKKLFLNMVVYSLLQSFLKIELNRQTADRRKIQMPVSSQRPAFYLNRY